ncbi:bacterio-opsin activator domain-containing protein [Natronomonas sp. LN261]|jgi:PAS domain S-box-containing protein|uniref:bacterio-opsin activator domain-containing protein n=1 Tax=Natronomonas sp. LN261 TaxID=2750669 RepID=UPI0015EF5F6E|nr:bacterio-opsin activator domain-containing protein [Natronomonas sp. LN261]
MLVFDVLLVGEAPSRRAVLESFPDDIVDTTVVSGADDALEVLETTGSDCVVTDYDLPARDGLDLLASVRESFPALPVVVYTADGDEAVAEAAIDAGVTAYVPASDGSGGDGIADRAIEQARRNHVSTTVDESDPTAANLKLAELAMDEAPVGITVADPNESDEPLIYVNDAFERLTGYDTFEILGRNCRFLQGEGTDPETVERVRQAVDDRRPISVEILNYRKNGEPFWNQLNIAPVTNDDDELTHFLGFQTDVTERKEIELRSQRQAEQLRADRRARERLLARLDGIIQRVTASTVNSTSRAELEERVCKAILETNDYEAAWFGTRQATSDRIVVNERAGCGGADEPAIPADAPDDPADEAIRNGTVTIAETGSLRPESPHGRFAPPDGGLAAIPLRYRDADYGVLVVYVSQSAPLDDHETAVFEALGRVIGTGINALQNQRLLATDEYLELTFTGRPPAPVPAELAAQADCEITYRGAVSRSDGQFVLSALVSGAAFADIEEAAATLSRPPNVSLVASYDDACLVEIVPAGASVVRTVLDHNGSIRSLSADGDVVDLRIEIPQTTNPNTVVGAVLDRYGGLSLSSQRRRERDRDSRKELTESLRANLTDRQLEAIQKAYLSDYFEWPRPVSGESIADSMGITRSTFHQHLRAAQSKIIGELLEDVKLPRKPN